MELNFKTFGQGPPLVILHGLFGTLDNWQTLAKRWAETYTVYLVDQRNHGRSPHLDTHSYPEMAADLAQFLEKEWVHRCHLLGHSMGGKTAMQLAMDFPDLIEKLIVVDITPRRYPSGHDEIFEALTSVRPAEITERSLAQKRLTEKIGDPGVVQFLLKNLTRRPEGGFRWKMNLAVLRKEYDKILMDLSGEPFTGPSLFIRGERSNYVHDEDMSLVKKYFTEAELVTIDGAGHWVHAERPDALYEAVSEFLR